MKHQAESGTVKGKAGKVVWTMSADEAEEIADYIERSSTEYDAARTDVAAIRAAIADARVSSGETD